MRRFAVVSIASLAMLATANAFAQSGSAPISVENLKEAPIADRFTEDQLEALEPLAPPTLSEEDLRDLLEQPAPITDDVIITIEPTGPEDRSEISYGKVMRADITKDPWRRGGKLFMAGIGTCTAQFVGATDVVMTAAHCIYNRQTQQWASDVLFARAYANGGGERFDWQCMGILNGYTSSNPWPWDFAFIKVRGNSSVGALGLRTGLPYNEWWSIGYPGNFEGARYMQKVFGRKGAVGGGVAQMLDNPMTFGASGGGWWSGNYAIGLNSFLKGNPNDSRSLYGPVLTSATVTLFNYVKNSCQ